MKYVALLRGINVGGKNKVEMNRLRDLFIQSNFSNVETYLNTGNVIFESNLELENMNIHIQDLIQKEFGFEIPTLILESKILIKISKKIPDDWKNDSEEKTDIAFLFSDIDYKDILNQLPIKKEYVNLIYTQGAVIWNIKKTNYSKSQLNKIIQSKIYKSMTVRNVNTVRNLVGIFN